MTRREYITGVQLIVGMSEGYVDGLLFLFFLYAYIRIYVIYAFIIFLVSIFAGYYTTTLETEELRVIFNQLLEDSSVLSTVGPVTLFIIIFLNNTIKSLFAILLGTFFGIVPLLMVVANGYLLGVISYFAIESYKLPLLMWGIIPHGIIKIPILIISTGYGLWLGNSFIRKIRYKEPMKQNIRIALQIFSKYLIPLLFFAAFVEVFITDFFLTLVI